MKKIILLFSFCLLAIVVSAQTHGVLTGKVYSSVTAAPLAGTHVMIKALNLSSSTNTEGVFAFNNVPYGKYVIVYSYVGYETDSAVVKVNAPAQKIVRTLFPSSISIAEVIVTATRSEQPARCVPAKVDVITTSDIEAMPYISTDELLNLSAGINASRNYGIYNKTGDVTLRGLNRNVHTLLLMDGVPLSILDGSASNWNRIDADNIERIEVLKGPNSSLYGGNAMAGVINIITRKPTEKLSGSARIFYGSYNTSGLRLSLNGRTGTKDRNYLYAAANAYSRQSTGYIMTPEEIRDTHDVKMYVNEYNLGLKTGYVFKPGSFIEAEYNYSLDNRGNGTQIFEPQGNFNEYKTHYARGRYSRKAAKSQLEINGFFKSENYFKQNESLKSNGLYYFYTTKAVTQDYGLWLSWSGKIGAHQDLTIGADVKNGNTDNLDRYHSSYDSVMYDGNMGFYGIFAQDMLTLFKGKMNISAGVRGDMVSFGGAGFHIASPGLATSFMAPYEGDFNDTVWFALSPRVGMQWNFNPKHRIYLSWSRGFRSGTLSDMCRTGDVNKGFKLANPGLSPESMDNVEMGAVMKFFGKLNIEPAVFFSQGHNFQYFVGTGDSIFTTGSNMKPVIRRENIGEVQIYGAEIKCVWQINTQIELLVNYSYTHSNIVEYDLGAYVGKDLTGASLIEVPDQILFARMQWKNRFINTVVGAKYFDGEWVDDENTLTTDPYFLLDLKLYRTFLKRITTSLTIQNILNNRFTDSKGMLSPGIFCIGECRVNF